MRSIFLTEIAEYLSQDIALLLSKYYAGTLLYVPKEATIKHPIAVKIGYENMTTLCKYYGGERIFIPYSNKKKEERMRLIATLKREGAKTKEIAQLLGCTERTIFYDKAEMKRIEKAKQWGLFEKEQ